MRKTIVICDVCKEEKNEFNSCVLYGNSYDVCAACADLLEAMLKQPMPFSSFLAPASLPGAPGSAQAAQAAPEEARAEEKPVEEKPKRGKKAKVEPKEEEQVFLGHDTIVELLGLDMRRPDEAKLAQTLADECANCGDAMTRENALSLLQLKRSAHPILFDPQLPHHRGTMQGALEALGLDFSNPECLDTARRIKEKALLKGVALERIEAFCKEEMDVGF